MTAEEWRPVPDFPGYWASDQGRIASTRRYHGSENPRILRARFKSRGGGYPVVNLMCPQGGRKTLTVHTLVTTAFLGPRPSDLVVRHLDGDVLNAHLGNLRYGTRTENELDKVRHGTHPQARKTHCPQGHPYDEANTEIRVRTGGVLRRRCLTCRREAQRIYSYERYWRLKAGVAA